MFRARRFADCQAGAAAVEFAIIGLLTIAVCLGVIEFGRGLHIRNGMSHAADVGARGVLLDRDIADAELANRIRQAFHAASPEKLAIELSHQTVGGRGFQVIVMSYPFNLLIPNLMSDPISISITRNVPVI